MSKYSAEEVWDMFKDTFYMTDTERLDCFDTTYMGALFNNFTIDGAMSTYNMWKEKQKPKYEIGDILLVDVDNGSCEEAIVLKVWEDGRMIVINKDTDTYSISDDEVIEILGKHANITEFFEE